jgi:hypothetical protein
MAFDDYNFRPITFQGVTFPATLMGISVFLSMFDIPEEDFLGDWIWRLSNCRGVSKRAPAERCAECARRTADLMLENRQKILDHIRENLASYGLDPEETYRDWLLALQKIAELSAIADGECVWSAPLHPRDPYKTPAEVERAAKRFLDWLDEHKGGKPIKFYDKEEPPPPQIP